MAEVRQPPHVLTPGCTGIRARNCSSWAANSARSASGITIANSIGISSQLRNTTACAGSCSIFNYTYKNEPALWDLDDTYDGFEWIDFHDADNSVVAFMRRSQAGDVIVFVVNATPQVLHGYRIGVPTTGFYREIINTDGETYGGSNVGNMGGLEAAAVRMAGPHAFVDDRSAAARGRRFQVGKPASRQSRRTPRA